MHFLVVIQQQMIVIKGLNYEVSYLKHGQGTREVSYLKPSMEILHEDANPLHENK